MKHREQLERARLLSVKEISVKMAEGRKELFIFQQEKILGKLKNVAQINHKRREIARLATILDEKVSQAQSQK